MATVVPWSRAPHERHLNGGARRFIYNPPPRVIVDSHGASVNWSTAGLAASTLLASAVEFVEAFTIVVAIGLTRGSRAPIWVPSLSITSRG